MMSEKIALNIRLGATGVAWIDQTALDESGVHPSRRFTRADVVRASLLVARTHEKEVRDVLKRQL